jgi:hypothetical protein
MKTTYDVDVPINKTKEKIERAYEITKYLERKEFGTIKNRYKINLRVSIL